MSDHLPIGPLSLSFFVQVQIKEHQGRGDPSTSRASGSGSRMGLPWQFGKQARVQTRLDLRGRKQMWTIITRHTQSFCPRCSFKSRISLTTTSRDKATLSSCKSDRWHLASMCISYISYLILIYLWFYWTYPRCKNSLDNLGWVLLICHVVLVIP